MSFNLITEITAMRDPGCARSDIFRATDQKVELLSTLLLHNFGGKCRSARKIPPSGKQASFIHIRGLALM